MDKTWMTQDSQDRMAIRMGWEYRDGVKSFIEFAKANVGDATEIRYPCRVCKNNRQYDYETVNFHICRWGMLASYKTWIYHREITTPVDNVVESEHGGDSDYEDPNEYQEMMEDHYMGTYTNAEAIHSNAMHHFEKMLDASQRPLYPGWSPNNTILDFVIKMMEQKVEGKWSNKSFNNVMQIQKALLPDGNLVPDSIYAAKKILRDLGLGCEHIDAYHNDCALFWKENIDLEKCPVCEESRYKLNNVKGKKIPHKVLRYFPLIPRLQRLYMSKKTATHMRWHSDKCKDDGICRHPADFEEWKGLDKEHSDFAGETRNIRLGLASDGFNPSGDMSTSYSMWLSYLCRTIFHHGCA
ncbi:hypothetical protein AAC387_Pa04g1284 [Persea americana]